MEEGMNLNSQNQDQLSVYTDNDSSYFTPENLKKDPQFLADATRFLAGRTGLTDEDAANPDAIYDEFMEHFRVNATNEVTAIKDFLYASEDGRTEEDLRALDRLMDTFTKTNDFGLKALGDYAEGIFTSPSTYGSLFTFGSSKVGAVAANQGIRLALKQILKKGAGRAALVSAASRAGAGAAAVEGAGAGARSLAQEATRVETGSQEDIDYGNVATDVAIAGGFGLVTGGASGIVSARRANAGQRLANVVTRRLTAPVNSAYVNSTKPILEGTGKGAKKIKKIALELKEQLPLEATMKELLEEGRGLQLTPGTATSTVEFASQAVDNTVVATAKILDKLPKAKVIDGKVERITSQMARGVAEGKITSQQIDDILSQHGVTSTQFSAVFGSQISQAAREMNLVGQVAKKRMVEGLTKELSTIDGVLSETYKASTARATRALEDLSTRGPLDTARFVLNDVAKYSVGSLTVNPATTVRNTAGGIWRNALYGLENITAGAARYIQAKGTLAVSSKQDAIEIAAESSRLALAEINAGRKALIPTDLLFGTNAENFAMRQILSNPLFGFTEQGQRVFRELGDLGLQGSKIGPLTTIAAKANVLNTLSDNMFKRAIFGREMDKILRANGVEGGLLGYMKKGGTFQGETKKQFREWVGQAAQKAMEITYQDDFQKVGGNMDRASKAFIKMFSSPVGSVLVPFPRYIANQLRFAIEHTPVIGALNFYKRLDAPEIIAKQVGGLATISAFIGLKAHFSDHTTGPTELKDPLTGKKTDLTAIAGPYLGSLLIADWMYRNYYPDLKERIGLELTDQERQLDPVQGPKAQDWFKAITGGDYRTNQIMSTIDSISGITGTSGNDLKSLEKWNKFMRDTLGDLSARLTVPVGFVRDTVSTIDKDYEMVPFSDSMNLLDHLVLNAARGLPQYYDKEKELITNQYIPDTDPLYLPSRDEPAKRYFPLLKQITGMEVRYADTPAEEFFNAHGITWQQYSPPRIPSDPERENISRKYMGQLVHKHIGALVTMDEKFAKMAKAYQVEQVVERLKDFKKIASGMSVSLEGIPDDDNRLEELESRSKILFLKQTKVRQNVILENFKGKYDEDFDPDKHSYTILWAQSDY